jgi:long-chain acyl-CoA synthetase
MTQDLARGILKHDLAAEVDDNELGYKLKVLGICSVNREEWVVTDLACNLLGITSVPLYETLGDEMLQLILS